MKRFAIICFFVVFWLNAWSQDIEKAFEYYNAGMYAEAADEFEALLPLLELEYGKNDTSVYAKYLIYTGAAFYESQQIKEAEYYLLLSRDVYQQNNATGDEWYGIVIEYLISLYEDTRQYEKALPLLLEVLENIEKHFGINDAEYIVSVNRLASLYHDMGQYDKALPLYLMTLESIAKTAGKDHSNYGIVLNDLALLYGDIGQYDKALTLQLEALENTERAFGKDHAAYGVRLYNLAALYSTIGQYERALSLYIESLENTERSLGKEHPIYEGVFNNLAELYRKMGQYGKALTLLQGSLENKKKIMLGKEHSSYWIGINNLATLYRTIGQYDKALQLHLEALEVADKTVGKEHSQYAISLGNLALLYEKIGLYDKALSFCLEAHEIIERSYGRDHSYYGTIINNLASLYKNIGQYEKALPFNLEALENAERLFGKDHSQYGLYLNNLAILYCDMGQYEKALLLLLDVLENTERTLGKEHSEYGLSLNNLAGLYKMLGQHEKVLPLYQNAIENNFTNLDQTFAFLSESEKENFLETIAFNFQIYQSFFLQYTTQQPSVAGDAFSVELATKSMILNSGIQMRQAIAGSGDSVAMAKFDEWLMNRNILAMQYSLPIAERRSDLAEFEDKTDRLESELSRVSAPFSHQVSIGQLRWQHVQEQLQDGESAIEFSSFNYHDGKQWTDSTLYCALVLTKDCEYPHMIFLFEEQDLLDVLPDPNRSNHWEYNLAYQGTRASGTVFYEQETYRGDKLYELIWQPIDSLLQDKGTETIYFAPSGLLHTVSFAAIPTPDGELLMEKYNLVQLGSTRTVAIQQDPVGLKNAVVFGGIDYDLEGEELELIAQQFKENESYAFQYMPYRASDTRYGGFTYLEGSLVEAKKVSALLSENISTTTITGRDAVEESFKALSGSHAPCVIHIATHGFYFPDTISDKSREQMMFTAIGEERFRVSDDPLMRSALVMAGANHAWQGKPLPPGVQDGILTARDVSAMNLANTELVVLSACQTGLGDVKGSEGVTGLQRAFKMAGVRYIIMSLWPVPDKETVEFMESFYSNWLGGMEIRSAFTNTQKHMHERYPAEPFKWAAFVLSE